MATASPLCNFLSLLLPSKRPRAPKPSPTLSFAPLPSLSTPPTQSLTRRDCLTPSRSSSDVVNVSSGPDSLSVVCPSLANANVMFFKSAYNVQVVVDENESEDRLLNRFRREVMKLGIIREVRRRRYFENKQEEKKRRTRDAARRNRKKRFVPRANAMQKSFNPEAPKTKKDEDDDDDSDNWDMPEGGLPF